MSNQNLTSCLICLDQISSLLKSKTNRTGTNVIWPGQGTNNPSSLIFTFNSQKYEDYVNCHILHGHFFEIGSLSV